MRWASLLLKIPDNWMTHLLGERSDVHIRVFGCMPYGSEGGRGLVRLNSTENLDPVLVSIRNRDEVLRANFQRMSEESAFGEVIIDRCAACSALKQSECFMVSSRSCGDGWLEWSVAAESNVSIHDLTDLLEKNGCEVEITRVSASSGTLGLTKRQEEILQFAYTNGFYEYPRRISLRDLSLIFDISASTMSEILRAGQRRVFSEYFRVA